MQLKRIFLIVANFIDNSNIMKPKFQKFSKTWYGIRLLDRIRWRRGNKISNLYVKMMVESTEHEIVFA
jgi:hypothetical protein